MELLVLKYGFLEKKHNIKKKLIIFISVILLISNRF